MEDGEEKDQLISQIASQMKKSYTEWNKEADDDKIIEDLDELSQGKIKLDSNYTIINISTSKGTKRKSRATKGQRRK